MRRSAVLSLIVLLLAGCSFPQAKAIPTEDIDAIVRAKAATVFARYTETSVALQATRSETPTPPSTVIPSATAPNAPIPEPVDATASINVTVYDEPRNDSNNVGMIFFNQSVLVIARSDNSNWYYIQWPKSPTATAWVMASAVDMKENDPASLPVAVIDSAGRVMVLMPTTLSMPETLPDPGLAAARAVDVIPEETPPHEATPTPVPPPANPTGAVRTYELHVRSGPASVFTSLGQLHWGDTVVITGMTINRLWYRIEYAAAPDGYGYVATKYIDVSETHMSGLQSLNYQGTPIP